MQSFFYNKKKKEQTKVEKTRMNQSSHQQYNTTKIKARSNLGVYTTDHYGPYILSIKNCNAQLRLKPFIILLKMK